MKIIDRKLWERELTNHMRRHAADLHDSPHAPPKPGVWMSGPRFLLWTIMVMIMTSAGWAIGLYLF